MAQYDYNSLGRAGLIDNSNLRTQHTLGNPNLAATQRQFLVKCTTNQGIMIG
jgi:hypothetical protein